MSLFWSLWVTILSLVCWFMILGVLVWTLKSKPTLDEDGTTGHVYDGIREFDKPMPFWWLIIFFATLAWGILYFVLFPGLMPGYWNGLSTVEVDGEQVPWTSHNELTSEFNKNNAIFVKTFNETILKDKSAIPEIQKLYAMQAQLKSNNPPADIKQQIDTQVKDLGHYVADLSNDPRALKIGGRLFLQNCSVCHGSQARGALGYPNLTDNDWLYGGQAGDILTTLHNGRIGGMPAWRDQLGEDGVRATAEYVMSIAGRGELDSTLVNQGRSIYKSNCAVCHGQEGEGSVAVGAPNLTDDIWLYGGSREDIRETLRYGRAGVMPAWSDKLGNERIMLISAYVYSLTNK